MNETAAEGATPSEGYLFRWTDALDKWIAEAFRLESEARESGDEDSARLFRAALQNSFVKWRGYAREATERGSYLEHMAETESDATARRVALAREASKATRRVKKALALESKVGWQASRPAKKQKRDLVHKYDQRSQRAHVWAEDGDGKRCKECGTKSSWPAARGTCPVQPAPVAKTKSELHAIYEARLKNKRRAKPDSLK